MQQLLYTYDPVGNITEIEDQAYKPVYFANGIAEPKSQYEYDALYRLISATGRETAQGGDALKESRDADIGNGFSAIDRTDESLWFAEGDEPMFRTTFNLQEFIEAALRDEDDEGEGDDAN